MSSCGCESTQIGRRKESINTWTNCGRIVFAKMGNENEAIQVQFTRPNKLKGAQSVPVERGSSTRNKKYLLGHRSISCKIPCLNVFLGHLSQTPKTRNLHINVAGSVRICWLEQSCHVVRKRNSHVSRRIASIFSFPTWQVYD